MALSDSVLSQLIQANIGTLNSGDENVDKAFTEGTQKLADAIAQAVVTHITSMAVVTVTVATTGSAAAQTGTGTGTIS